MIRQAKSDDILSVYTLLCKTPDSWSIDLLTGAFANPRSVILVYGETNVYAAAVFSVAAAESELHNIVVSDKMRRCGIGESLLREGFKLCSERAAEVLYLEVRDSNNAARALYEKLGFYTVGRRKEYYKTPTEDAVLMKKDLI